MTYQTNQDLLPNQYVYVNVYKQFFKIGEVEPFVFDTGRESTAYFSAIASGATSGYQNILELQPEDKPRRNLFQVLIGVQYKMRYYFKIPTGTNRFGTDVSKDIGYLTPTMSPYFNPNKNFQMWFVDEYYPSVNVTNDAPFETLRPRFRVVGFKYELLECESRELERLQSGSQIYKHITVGGLN